MLTRARRKALEQEVKMQREEFEKVNARDFYSEYHGHKVKHLEIILPRLKSSCDSLIWTAGDSSLDNKYWFRDQRQAVGVYRDHLDPPRSICDVTYWLNFLAEQRHRQSSAGSGPGSESTSYAAINTAVEATTLNERTLRLRSQDVFIRDNITSDDVLIVSVGGNDVALMPSPCTIFSMASLLCLPTSCIEHGKSCCAVPMDDYCCGCGPSICSCAGSFPPCLGYFRHLFGTRVQKYIESLTSKTKPKKILVCMIYYLDEVQTPSWAGTALGALGYDSNPAKLQTFIRKVFEEATSRIQIEGSEVIPVPLFNVLDGKTSQDYVARVEPSALGGRKMAEYLLDIIDDPSIVKKSFANSTGAPSSALISDRN